MIVRDEVIPDAKVNGININYNIFGEGEPLILIIGLSSDQSNWRQTTEFFKKFYRTITLDNRGWGKSDKPPGPYTIKTMADDTLGLMNHLGIEKAHILGVSMGGMIAQELALNYPERVNKLIMGCTFARIDETSGFSPEISKELEVYGKSSRDKESSQRLAISIIDSSVNKGTSRMILLPLMKFAIKSSPLNGFIEQLDALLAHDVKDRLGRIIASTLVIVGTDDRVIKPASSDVIASLVPKSKLVKLKGGSHAFSGEMSSEFNKAVFDFLRS